METRQCLRPVVGVLLLCGITGSVRPQTPSLPPGSMCTRILSAASRTNEPAPPGTRELICPHSAARAMNGFVALHEANANETARALYKGAQPGQWAFAKVGLSKVPTLEDDGSTLDTRHPNDTSLLLYVRQTGTIEKTYWAHRYNKGAIVFSADRQTEEGVNDLRGIKQEFSRRRFALLEYVSAPPRPEDTTWTNTILIHGSDKPEKGDFSRFRMINEQLLDSLPPDDLEEFSGQKVIFVTSARNSAGDELVTFYSRSPINGHLQGEVHNLKNASELDHHRDLINEMFRGVGKGGRVYFYGDNVQSIDVASVADANGLELIRRSAAIRKNFLETDSELQLIASRNFDKETTALMNAVPSTKEELEFMNKPATGLDNWKTFRDSIESQMQGRFSSRIETPEDLKKELTDGESDILFFLAHTDGKNLYLGTNRVSLDEISSLGQRENKPNRPRLAILFICDSGKLPIEKKTPFRRQVKSFGEILVAKGFVSEVLAPAKEIEGPESVAVLTQIFQGSSLNSVRKQRKGWSLIAGRRELDRVQRP